MLTSMSMDGINNSKRAPFAYKQFLNYFDSFLLSLAVEAFKGHLTTSSMRVLIAFEAIVGWNVSKCAEFTIVSGKCTLKVLSVSFVSEMFASSEIHFFLPPSPR